MSETAYYTLLREAVEAAALAADAPAPSPAAWLAAQETELAIAYSDNPFVTEDDRRVARARAEIFERKAAEAERWLAAQSDAEREAVAVGDRYRSDDDAIVYVVEEIDAEQALLHSAPTYPRKERVMYIGVGRTPARFWLGRRQPIWTRVP